MIGGAMKHSRFLRKPCSPQQVEAFDRGDVDGLLKELGSDSKPLLFVIDNVAALKRRGILERALVTAWMTAESNHRNVPLHAIEAVFKAADRKKLKLLATGDELPARGAFTVYRGVAGKGPARRIRGMSWTGSLPAACWFALRFRLDDPAIFAAWVNWYEVLWYKCGFEDEFLCRPRRVWRLLIPLKEMRALSRAYLKSVHECT